MNVVMRSFDMGGIVTKLARVLPEAMRVLPEIVIDQARLMISSTGGSVGMVQIIPPAHAGVKNAAAGKYGERKVAADISRVYLTPAGAYQDIKDTTGKPAADAFYAALKGRTVTVKGGKNRRIKGTPEEAERILRQSGGRYKNVQVGPFDGGQAHRDLRLSNGTIGKRVLPRLVVLDPKALKEFIKHKQSNVGIMGSAFNRAAAQFGAKGMPAYVTRHGDKFSSVQILTTSTAFWVVMTPRINFGMEEIDRRWAYVLQYRMNAMDRAGFITRIRKVFLEPARSSAAA